MNEYLGGEMDQSGREEPLSIEVTTECNSACSHCFVRAGVSDRPSLSVNLVKKIITEGHQAGYTHLHITGGEPLLWEGLLEVLDHTFDSEYKTVFLNTNGTLLTDDVNRRLATYEGITISASLQGPKALHDSIRGEGSYRLTVRNIEKALDAGMDLFIFTTVCKSLIHDLPHFAEEIHKKFAGLNCLTLIQLIRVADDTFDLSKELLGPDDFLKLVWIASLLNLYGLKTYVLGNPLADVVSKLYGMPLTPHSHPLYRDNSIFVMANRSITLSHSSRDSFGKYAPGMIGKVLASDVYRKAIAPDESTCPRCKYTEVCMEKGMVRPSEWFRDMHPEVPYCKRVLDRAVLWSKE